MVLDVEYDPVLPELWPWEGPKLKLGKYSKWICFCKILLLFLAFLSPLNQKNVFKNYLTRFLRFLAFQNCPWSSECAKNHGSDSKFKFLFQNKGLQISDLEIFSREDLEGKIHFEYFPSLSFGPSQGHNSVNTGSNSTSRTIFEN